jgi:hypothetical protein
MKTIPQVIAEAHANIERRAQEISTDKGRPLTAEEFQSLTVCPRCGIECECD